MAVDAHLTFGFPRMHEEAGERRDFLPELIASIARRGCHVFVESGIGSAMGFTDLEYFRTQPGFVHVVDEYEAYRQDVVVVLRAPRKRLAWIRPGATLVSMLHFPTRPARVRELRERGIDAVSLDSIEDDDGRRLVVNAHAVAWNGLEAAFDVLERTWPPLLSRDREPVRVTVLGAGEIGRHAVEAATKYGSLSRAARLARRRIRGVEVTTLGRNITGDQGYMLARLAISDVLVDATYRSDPSVPIVRNAWIGAMPPHAVICDLVVDPYLIHDDPPGVRGIEGIPQGTLDRYAFDVDDPAWDDVPPQIPSLERRRVVSCYSWPGVHPRQCMELYGRQLDRLLGPLIERGGIDGLDADAGPSERALLRAALRTAPDRTVALAGA